MATGWRDRRQQQVPLELWEVLAEEFEASGHALPAAFDRLADGSIARKQAFDQNPAEQSAWDMARRAVENQLFQHMDQVPRTALCFSGGGVRSCTFGLGVLQGLATASFTTPEGVRSPLSEFDFLSTVSGGGYLGGWFSAWAAREEERTPNGVEAVVQALGAAPTTTLEPEPRPLLHIRQYCAFLDPKLGLLSADTWTLIATVARNMILNWLILVPLLMAVLLVPAIYSSLLSVRFAAASHMVTAALYFGIAAGMVATAFMTSHLPSFSGPNKAGEDAFIAWALVPLAVSAVSLSLHWAWYIQANNGLNYDLWHFARFGAEVHTGGAVVGGLILFFKKRRDSTIAILGLAAAAVSGAAAGSLTFLVSGLFVQGFAGNHRLYTCVAIPVIFGAFLITTLLAVGLASQVTGDDDREWWARAGAWLLIASVGWLVLSISVVYGPMWLDWGVKTIATAAATVSVGGVASWIGFSARTSGRQEDGKDVGPHKSGSLKDVAAALAGPAFLLLLIALLAKGNDGLITQLPAWLPGWAPARLPAWWPLLPSVSHPFWVRVYLGMWALLIAMISSWFININRFSLHAMYRARLVRTYLGASRLDRRRTVNPFTDLDERDNVAMSKLSRHRPLHIVNMALNLVGGKNLAWQQRKAESFTSSRLRTGSLRVGYQKTESYGCKRHGDRKGLTLGSAVTISGAAASPNMGYHSSPVISLIMTLFNARLGWWLANPGPEGKGAWAKDGPTLAFMPIINEALGRTSDESSWVYLSDGGHFENLGLYEMVLRRCATIVVVDGGQDPSYLFEDLGNAVRKIRVDLGISIEFPDGLPIYAGRDLRNRYCAKGRIRYDLADPAGPGGTILYIKPCLNGTEPTDVLHYSSLDTAFPQQGTEELWFDESQFESYRRLGSHIVEQILSAASALPPTAAAQQLVRAGEQYIGSGNSVRHTRWPGPTKIAGTITGTVGGSSLAVTTDIVQG